MPDTAPPQTPAPAAFLAQLRQAVLTEAAIVRHHIHEQWAQSVAARVAAGRAIDQVAIAQARQDGALILTCPRNDSRFREGDVLCLNRGDPFEPPHLIVTLEEDDDTRLQVLVENFGVNWGELARQPTDWVLDEGFLDLSRYVLDALDEAADTAAGRDHILTLLTEETTPALSVARYEAALAYAAAQGLNDEQAEALAGAYGSACRPMSLSKDDFRLLPKPVAPWGEVLTVLLALLVGGVLLGVG